MHARIRLASVLAQEERFGVATDRAHHVFRSLRVLPSSRTAAQMDSAVSMLRVAQKKLLVNLDTYFATME